MRKELWIYVMTISAQSRCDNAEQHTTCRRDVRDGQDCVSETLFTHV